MKKILAAGALLPVLCVSAGAAEEGRARREGAPMTRAKQEELR